MEEFEAVEAEELFPSPVKLNDLAALMEQERDAAPLVYWEVWFREEYFGKVPDEIIGDVLLIMMDYGGFVRDPGRRRLESMHSPAGYNRMATGIVARLNRWMLVNNRTTV